MPNTPEECLTPSNTVNAQPDRDAQHVGGVQKRSDDATGAFNCWRPANRLGDACWVPRLEKSIWAEVKVNPDVGEAKQGAGCEGDGPILVVGIEA